jgi:hypothetical protein
MSDLISRQDVFDMIDAVFREECEKRNTTYEEADEMTQWYLCGMMTVMEKVFDIPSASRWIPVSEKLPERNKMDSTGKYREAYLVTTGFMTFTARFNEYGYWVLWGYHQVLKNIIAWMPLPEPYKEEE